MRAKIIAIVAAALLFGPASANPTRDYWEPGSKNSITNLKDKIKTVVVLMMENRSVDNLLGGQKVKGLDNPILKGPFCNPQDINHPHNNVVCTHGADYDSILNDPDHSVHGNNYEFYSNFSPDNAEIARGALQPNMKGFVAEQLRVYNGKADNATLIKQVMNYYTEEQVPVITALTHNFTVFNHWHSDHPGVR